MKLGLLADIHGNSIALELCLKALAREKISSFIFLGDAVGYLPMANEVVKRLKEIKATCLMGNHEAMLLGKLELTEEHDQVYGISPTREEMAEDMVEEMRHWSLTEERIVNGRRLLFVHGSPWENLTGYVYPDGDIGKFSELDSDVVFMGHTHHPFVAIAGNTRLVNIGSCGLPRDHGSLSSCAVYDTQTGECRILRVPFDCERVLSLAKRPVHPSVISTLRRKGTEKPVGEILCE